MKIVGIKYAGMRKMSAFSLNVKTDKRLANLPHEMCNIKYGDELACGM